MDRAKIFKDYFVSSQNTVLIPSEDFGRRKFINVGVNRSLSLSRIEELVQNHTDEMRSGNKQWIHPPDALTRGHIIYNVKFYGECNVDAPKGTDVVKDAIRKRKFNKTLRKTEGQKTPKVELSISIDGVTIQEPKTKIIKHQYPLHRISYCADDKTDKRMFTFIAKAPDSNVHYCYVFASEKNAEEITLTIGQAFDLAYRRFLDTQGKDGDTQRQQANLAKRVETLERENAELRQRIRELEMLKDRKDVENYKQSRQISELTRVGVSSAADITFTLHHQTGETSTDSPAGSQPGSPKQTSVGRKLENLMFEPATPQPAAVSNGSAHSPQTPGIISPPPASTRSRSHRPGTPGTPTAPKPVPPATTAPASDVDEMMSLFTTSSVGMQQQQQLQQAQQYSSVQQQNNYNNNLINPFSSPAGGSKDPTDPFGMATFSPAAAGSVAQPAVPANSFNDLQAGFNQSAAFNSSQPSNSFQDLQAGFSEGLSFGTGDFGMKDFTSTDSSYDEFYN